MREWIVSSHFCKIKRFLEKSSVLFVYGGPCFWIFFFHPFLQDFFQDSDDDWVFDPDIDTILEAHGQKRKRGEAFSDDDDNVSDKTTFFL